MKNFKIFACLLVVGGLSLYGWHLYMKAHLADYINAQPYFFQVKKKGKADDTSNIFHLISRDDVPEEYRSNIEIIRKGDDYFWVSNGNKKLTKSVKSEGLVSQGVPTGKYKETYVYSDVNGRELVTLRVSDYDLAGCREKESFWTGNLSVLQSMNNGDILEAKAYVEIYHNPYQYLLCDYHYKLFSFHMD